MTITRAALESTLVPGLNAITGLAYNSVEGEHKALFAVENSERAFEEELHLTGFGEAVQKAEGSAIFYDEARETWTSRYVHNTYALAFAITQEAVEDNLYESQAKMKSQMLGRSMASTKEQIAANVFNNGFSTSFVGGDGKPLFADDHPTVSAGNFDNKDTAQMSETALEDQITKINLIEDDRGILIGARAEMLVIPPALKWTVCKILDSTLSVTNAELGATGITNTNEINALNKMGVFPKGYVVNHRLSSAANYFIKTDVTNGTKMFQRRSLTTAMDGDFDTDNVRYKASERYSFGWSDPRAWNGSQAA